LRKKRKEKKRRNYVNIYNDVCCVQLGRNGTGGRLKYRMNKNVLSGPRHKGCELCTNRCPANTAFCTV